MNRIMALALATVFTLGTTSMALAEDVAVKPAVVKEKGDMKDGKKFDRQKFHEEMFAKTDKDGDGVLSKEEFIASHRERAEKAFDAMDANKDGKLSKEELKEGRKAWHKKMRHGGKMGDKMGGPRGDGPPPSPPHEGHGE